jgi:hypothetical protein
MFHKIILLTIIYLMMSLFSFTQTNLTEKSLADPSAIKMLSDNQYASWQSEYYRITLTTEVDELTQSEQNILLILIDVAKIMDDIFWYQAYGDKAQLLAAISNPGARQLAEINYGVWNRLHGDTPIFGGIGEKPAGANFYPVDMTKEEFERMEDPSKTSLYTLIRRDQEGKLITVPYHKAFPQQVKRASILLKLAGDLAEDEGLKNYLHLRSKALLDDEYFASDMAWMDMKNNTIDFVVGPIENYEDQLFGYKAAHEAFVLVKDKNWSKKLDRYATLLPQLQKSLPVGETYKSEMPGSNSDLGVYDAVYYAGDCNAGSKTIAINLPNDPTVQLEKGSRKLQLKNTMRAKFDHILLPIANQLIDPAQIKHIKFDSFFENTMFHEVAHGLGVKNTINGKGEVRTVLKDKYSTIEEGKADIIGLYLITELNKMNEINVDLMDNYVTFMAGIFRSIRFGTSSAHAKANLVCFNFFREAGAFSMNASGQYNVDFKKMQSAMISLSEKILLLQGNGDYDGTVAFIAKYSEFTPDLKASIDKLKSSNIPIDVVFDQGISVLGLPR